MRQNYTIYTYYHNLYIFYVCFNSKQVSYTADALRSIKTAYTKLLHCQLEKTP